MPDDDRSSFTVSLRLSAIQACERLSEGKSVTLKWMTDHIERFRAGPTKPGRPKGTEYDDERHCIEMAKLILQGKAKSEYAAARLVSTEEAPHLQDAAIDRRRKKYPKNESDYVAQAKKELGIN